MLLIQSRCPLQAQDLTNTGQKVGSCQFARLDSMAYIIILVLNRNHTGDVHMETWYKCGTDLLTHQERRRTFTHRVISTL